MSPVSGCHLSWLKKSAKSYQDINSRGIPVLLVEQNARVALELAHRAYILELELSFWKARVSSFSMTNGYRKPIWVVSNSAYSASLILK